MIAIRTNCNGTLGHLARTRHLARELRARGHDVVLLLDRDAPLVPNSWLKGLRVRALYADEPAYRCEKEDAERTLGCAGEGVPELLIVDDYRLGVDWERAVGRANVPLVAIDDLGRGHEVDVLVEPGIARDEGTRAHGKGVVLRGGEFVMLDTTSLEADIERDGRDDTDEPTGTGVHEVLLSLGGGGDLSVLAALLERVIDALEDAPDMPPVTLRPVVGPQAVEAARIDALAACHPDLVRPVRGADSLIPWLRRASLFVGAAGTAIYESAACEVPAITFPIAGNQENEHDALARIGHYLHLDALRAADLPALARLVVTTLAVLPRFRALRAGAPCRVDGRGAERVADAVERLLCSEAKGGERAERHVRPLSSSELVPTTSRTASPDADGFRIVACDDRDINRYLDARNLAANRGNMTSERPISRVDHYRWWLTTTRRSWRVERSGAAELYIWHQEIVAAGVEALIGGWFVCRENVDITSVMAALQWQLETTDRDSPHLPWLAVIRRGNDFTCKMNRRSGFLDVVPGSAEERAIGELFPNAPREEFHFVHRLPAASESLHASGAAVHAE